MVQSLARGRGGRTARRRAGGGQDQRQDEERARGEERPFPQARARARARLHGGQQRQVGKREPPRRPAREEMDRQRQADGRKSPERGEVRKNHDASRCDTADVHGASVEATA